MKKENTSIRLKKIMSEKNLRQVDILELCKPYCEKYDIKLGKNDLSQYVSGKVEPGQKKLTILGMALNINEVWLMGYDVPKERGILTTLQTLKTEAEEHRFNQFLETLSTSGYEITQIKANTYEVYSIRYRWHFNITKAELLSLENNISNYVCYTTDKFFENKYNETLSQKRELIINTNNPSSNIANAANAINGSTPEDIQHDDDIMDDENF